MKIENLENLQELTTEEFSSIQGGLSIVKPDHIIDWKLDEPLPLPDPKPLPHPEPIPHPLPVYCYHKPISYPISSFTGVKEHQISFKLPWCAVIL